MSLLRGRLGDLFFCLSGFIFFWLYARPVGDGEVSARDFVILRLSRLYPLHLCTLLAVLLGQTLYAGFHQTGFVYPHNDLHHFVLHLFFLSSVSWEFGHSFNGPAWSISVEVILYASFFFLCWATRARPPLLAVLSVGLAIAGFGAVEYEPFSRGFGSFFAGGVTCYVFAALAKLQRKDAIARVLLLVTAGLWVATLWFSYRRIPLSSLPLDPAVSALFPRVVLFPLTILALALFEAGRGAFAKRLSLLGDISYSSYLWHFPLQLGFALVFIYLGVGSEFARSTGALVLYLSLLFLLSLASFHWLEMPAQRYFRRRWLGVRARERAALMPMRLRLTYTGALVSFGGAIVVVADALFALGIGYLAFSPWPAVVGIILAYVAAPALAERFPLERGDQRNAG